MRAEICTKQACLTLNQLHAELAGKILENKEEGERRAESMRHVEAVIKLLNPDFRINSIAIRRKKPTPYFKRGTIFRSVLETLREKGEALTASELTTRLLASKGVHDPPREVFDNMFSGIMASLKNNKGKSVRAVSDGRPARWTVL